MTKNEILKRFNELVPNARLLAVQLNGFNHSLFYDYNDNDAPLVVRFSHYTTMESDEASVGEKVKEILKQFNHIEYKHNAQEFVYVLPNER